VRRVGRLLAVAGMSLCFLSGLALAADAATPVACPWPDGAGWTCYQVGPGEVTASDTGGGSIYCDTYPLAATFASAPDDCGAGQLLPDGTTTSLQTTLTGNALLTTQAAGTVSVTASAYDPALTPAAPTGTGAQDAVNAAAADLKATLVGVGTSVLPYAASVIVFCLGWFVIVRRFMKF
jgi:hypothetical protein